MTYALKPIQVEAGVSPSTDSTPQATTHYTFSDKVRFVDGVPEKIGGWDTLLLTGDYSIRGVPRNVFSYVLAGINYYLIGTHTSLYRIVGNTLYNATPVTTTLETYNNRLATNHATLGSNPYATTNGSTVITVTDTSHKFRDGDVVSFSGATTFAGLASGDLNGAKSIANCTANTYQFTSGTAANATTSGGGASVVRASRLISVTHTNAYTEGDNIMVNSVASAVGGIATANITGIRVVRNVTGSGYDIVAGAFSTSAASSAGGDYAIYPQIPEGRQNSTTGSGYGMGLYGVGLYGVAKESSSPLPPSIWSFDRFGNNIIATQGNQTGLYSWNNTTTTLPALVTNAPTAINYCFVTDNIAVTLGADGQPNRVKWCDQGNLTIWTADATTNQAGEDDIEGAGEFISHASVRGVNLLYTRNATYSMRYIRKPFVFEFKPIDAGRGLISRNARVVVNGVAYWMGIDNFYEWRGGNVEVLGSNTTTESTIKEYVFGNIDTNNAVKAFAWYNARFNEIWWHYPSNGSMECDRIARFNVLTRVWTPDTAERTAGEYPNVLGNFPYLADEDAVIYRHENGYDANGVAMPWSLTTPFFSTNAKDTAILGGVYQDNTISNGDISLAVNTKRYPNQTADSSTYTITTENANLIFRKSARYWQYEVSGEVLGQFWRGGAWMEMIKGSGKR